MKFNNVYQCYKNVLLVAALTLVVGPVILPIHAYAQIIVVPTKSDLKVQIVIQTAPGVHQPVNVPSGTVVSAPPSPPSIINCPATAGVTTPATTDCTEIGLPSSTSIKLVAPAALTPNAQFYQWQNIPGFIGLSISNRVPLPLLRLVSPAPRQGQEILWQSINARTLSVTTVLQNNANRRQELAGSRS